MRKTPVTLKIAFTFLFILIIVMTPFRNYYIFLGGVVAISIFFIISKLSLSFFIKKTLSLLPFVVFVAIFLPFKKGGIPIFEWQGIVFYQKGAIMFFTVILKAWLSMWALTLLYINTPFPEIIRGLRVLGVPHIFIMLISFMYRYMYMFLKVAKDMEKARELRNFGKNRWTQIRVYANIIGLLFIKAYERGERIYDAMLLRGFDGKLDN